MPTLSGHSSFGGGAPFGAARGAYLPLVKNLCSFLLIVFHDKWEEVVEWPIQLLWRKKLSQELEYRQTLNFRSVSSEPSRNRDVFGHIFRLKIIYRPVYSWQIQLNNEVGRQKDRAEVNQLLVGFWEVRPQVTYSARGKARAMANFTYLQVNITDNPFQKPIPYEMGKGKKEGNSFLWNFRFEYFISSNVTTTITYTGRRDSGALRTIHLGQAEVRAFF